MVSLSLSGEGQSPPFAALGAIYLARDAAVPCSKVGGTGTLCPLRAEREEGEGGFTVKAGARAGLGFPEDLK